MDTTVVKAFILLETLAVSDRPLGVTELAEKLELGKSNVHRLLQTLIALKYATKADDGGYMASLRLWEFGSRVTSNIVMRDVARPYMRILSDLTNETVHLSQYQDGEVIYLDKIESKEPVRAYTELGGRSPAYCTATGKVIMAHLPDEAVSEVFDGASKMTRNTITDVKKFLKQSAESRQRRYAMNNGEWRIDVVGLASPIANSRGEVYAAIGISAPASRMSLVKLQKFAPELVRAGQEISMKLGCPKDMWEGLSTQDAPTPATKIFRRTKSNKSLKKKDSTK